MANTILPEHPATILRRDEWADWRGRIWDSMEARFGYPGLAPLEQYMLRSRKERRCVECGDPGTARQESILIKSVSHYFMCADCDQHYNGDQS